MAPVATTPPSSQGSPHYDIYRGGAPTLGGSNADNNAGIHRGNAGEKVLFTFEDGAFDLLSIDFEVILLEAGASSLTVTFNASSGATHTASSVGTIDFTTLSGWSNITSFTMEVPLGDYNCAQPNTDCSTVAFDNVTFGEATVPTPVPEPATLGVLAIGLVGLTIGRLRKVA